MVLSTLLNLVWICYCMFIDYLLYICVDVIFRRTYLRAAQRSEVEKNQRWQQMSALLLLASIAVYQLHHTPYLLWILIVLTFAITVRVSLLRLYARVRHSAFVVLTLTVLQRTFTSLIAGPNEAARQSQEFNRQYRQPSNARPLVQLQRNPSIRDQVTAPRGVKQNGHHGVFAAAAAIPNSGSPTFAPQQRYDAYVNRQPSSSSSDLCTPGPVLDAPFRKKLARRPMHADEAFSNRVIGPHPFHNEGPTVKFKGAAFGPDLGRPFTARAPADSPMQFSSDSGSGASVEERSSGYGSSFTSAGTAAAGRPGIYPELRLQDSQSDTPLSASPIESGPAGPSAISSPSAWGNPANSPTIAALRSDQYPGLFKTSTPLD